MKRAVVSRLGKVRRLQSRGMLAGAMLLATALCAAAPASAEPGDAAPLAPAVSPPDPGQPAAGRASFALGDLTFRQGDRIVRVARIEFEGATLPQADMQHLLDPASDEPVAARLGRLSADRVRVPEMRVEQVLDGQPQITIYRDLVLEGLVGGKIARTVAGGGTFTAGQDDSRTTGTFQRVEVAELDLALIMALASATDASASGQVFASVALDKLEASDATGGTAGLAALRLGALRAHAPQGGFAAAYATATATDTVPDKAAEEEQSRRSGEAALGLLGSAEIESFELTALELAAKDSPTSRIASLAYGPDGGGHDRIRLLGLSAGSDDGRVSVGEATSEGLDIKRTVLALVEVGSRGSPAAVRAAAAGLKPVSGRFHVAQMAVTIGAATAARPGRTGKKAAALGEPDVSIGSIDLVADYKADGAHSGRFTLADIVVPLRKDGVFGTLADLGYDRFTGGIAIANSYAPDRQEVRIDEFSLNAPGMGSVALTMRLDHVGPDAFRGDRLAAMEALTKASLRSATADIRDGGLVRRLLTLEAKRRHRPEAAIRREYETQAGLALPLMLGGSPAADLVGAAAARFLAKPGHLAIRLTPKGETGPSLAEFNANQPDEIIAKLNVEATTE